MPTPMLGDTFQTLYTMLQGKLKDSSATTTARCKTEINLAIKRICRKRFWEFMSDNDNSILGTGARQYTFTDTDFTHLGTLRVATFAQNGDTSSQFVVTTDASGTTFTYSGVGADPHIGVMYHEAGDYLSTTGFTNVNNNVTKQLITSVGTNWVKIAAIGNSETKTGITFTTGAKANGVPIRRSYRRSTAQQSRALLQSNVTTGISSWSTTLTDNPYSYINPTTIQFKLPITSNQVLFYDYRVNVPTMTGDSEVCVIPAECSDVIVALAFYTMMLVDDDSRFKEAKAEYTEVYYDMMKLYTFSEDIDDTMQPGGYMDN